ncbi:hypothetical protein [Burkholderia phage FLC9]|nr:hypothetical protein [Burkholderia phage FLC9]
MLDILRDYLVEATTPENVDLIEKAHDAFDRIGLPDYTPGFEQLLMINDESDEGDTLGGIMDLTRSLADNILQQHAIRVMEDASIAVRTEFIDALVDLQNASDHVPDILRIVGQEHSPEELFSELVALVGTNEAEHYLVDLEYVSQALIDKIKERAESMEFGTTEEDDQEREFREERIAKFNRFMHFLLDPELAIAGLVHKGIDAGYPFVLYTNLIGREFEGMDPVLAAQNLLGMAFYSGDGFGQPTQIIKQHLEDLVSDVDVITKIDIALNDNLVRFAAYESTLG